MKSKLILFSALTGALTLGGIAHAGILLATDFTDGVVWKFDSTTGAPLGTFATGLTTPLGITQRSNGDVYVTDGADVLRYGADGTPKGVFGAVAVPVFGVFGPDGNYYVSSFANDDVIKLDGTTGNYLGEVVPSGALAGADGVRFGPNGDLYVADYIGNTITEWTTAGSFAGTFIADAELNNPATLVFAPDGSVYVSNDSGQNILHYSGAGAFLGVLGTTDPLYPNGITIANGRLYAGCGCTGSGEIDSFDLATSQKSVLVPQNTPGFNDVEDVLVLTPEPGTLGLLALGFGLAYWGRFMRASRAAKRASDAGMSGHIRA